MNSEVALLSCAEYSQESVLQSIEKLLNLVPPPDVKGKIVLLKPNILSPKKIETAVCTNPAVIGAAVTAFLKRGAKKVLVGESPALTPSISAAKTSGLYEAAVQAGGEWIAFEDSIDIACPDGKIVKTIALAKALESADILISMPKLKTHQLMGYTGALKNLFGLMIGLQKAQIHFRFPEPQDFAAFLIDLNIAAKAHYCIMDAIIAMEGTGGPGSGDPVQVGILAASQNLLALDWTCASLVGYDPHNILTLQDALERGIWLEKPEDIILKGDDFQSLKPAHFEIVKNLPGTKLLRNKPLIIQKAAQFFFTLWPYFNARKCTQCGKCIEICPAKVLSFSVPKKRAVRHIETKLKRHINIDKKRCLRCYCCHEVCPSKAIDLKRNW